MLQQGGALLAAGVAVSAVAGIVRSHEAIGPSIARGAPAGIADLIDRLGRGPLVFVSASGQATPIRPHDIGTVRQVREDEVLQVLGSSRLAPDQAVRLWSFFADEDNAPLLTLPLLKALLSAGATPAAHEALWSQLAGMAQIYGRADPQHVRAGSLLGLFEANRAELLPLLGSLDETEPACDDMMILMIRSRVFGDNIEDSAAVVAGLIPAALAAHIERERSHNRPVSWEYAAFESMTRWKDRHLVPGGSARATTLAGLDADGRSFITMFNSLHELDRGYREVLLRGLGSVEIYNAVVGGEKELYRLGTSGYRAFLHAAILQGIHEAGSFEAFLDRAAPAGLAAGGGQTEMRRAMVFLRVAGAFGLLDTVLETVHDRDRFISNALAALADPQDFERNSSIVVDLLTARTDAPALVAFRSELLDRLYALYRGSGGRGAEDIYGSMLSVYQAVSGDHRDPAIDRAYPLDRAAFEIPFDRLFSRPDATAYVHTMFMRMDQTVDDVETFKAFMRLVSALGGTIENQQGLAIFRIAKADRRIEIYANQPSPLGVRSGIGRIAELLKDVPVQTVIGRGHTSIIKPLQEDARRVLGSRIKDVAAVVVGSCGGEASVRDLIATFGYIPLLTTKATGRQVINNTILRDYIAALLALDPEGRLDMTGLLEKSVDRFRTSENEDLQADARLYQVNMATVFAARLFDRYVRQTSQSWQSATR